MLPAPALLTQEATFVTVSQAVVIGEVSAPGRRPIPDDAVVDQLVAGTFTTPSAGDSVNFHGKSFKWRSIEAGKDGWFDDPALENGYLAVQITEPASTDVVLNAQGDSLVYVNGVPRAGDPYSYGYLNLPVHLKQGINTLLFAAGRGRISVRYNPSPRPVALQSADVTLPDILTTSKGSLDASVVTLNCTNEFLKGLEIRVIAGPDRTVTSRAASIPPYSTRKLAFKIPVPDSLKVGPLTVRCQLWKNGKEIDEIPLTVQVKSPLDLQRRTFVSQVDGSVQYFAVWPAKKPSPANALVLTLHGASVEAYGQAAAYGQKEWASIVAPTNRRPYGFDWEGVGRLDALEVLDLAKKELPHDPNRVDLTGHSMGGHGTWSIGTMEPGLFASIAPSAGWISFWSYAGGWNPPTGAPTLEILRRSMNGGDTLGRVQNALSENVYILHGDADDNVPVEQARKMRQALESLHHPNLQYHEQPGAGHWWGNPCVDWPPIFEMFAHSALDPSATHVDFTTQNPAMAATDRWVTIKQQEVFLNPSRIVADRQSSGDVVVATTNVVAFRLANLKQGAKVTIDGQTLPSGPEYRWTAGKWHLGRIDSNDKNPNRGSGFKQVFNHQFAFVVGTKGTPEENDWALSRAIFFAETMSYRGNGAVDIVLDRDYSRTEFRNRNLILFGNRTTNSAWNELLGKIPDDVASALDKPAKAALLIYPKPGERDTLVGAVSGSGVSGMRMADRLSLFSSGVDYPDWIVFDSTEPGMVYADGFFDNRWKYNPSSSAGLDRPSSNFLVKPSGVQR